MKSEGQGMVVWGHVLYLTPCNALNCWSQVIVWAPSGPWSDRSWKLFLLSFISRAGNTAATCSQLEFGLQAIPMNCDHCWVHRFKIHHRCYCYLCIISGIWEMRLDSLPEAALRMFGRINRLQTPISWNTSKLVSQGNSSTAYILIGGDCLMKRTEMGKEMYEPGTTFILKGSSPSFSPHRLVSCSFVFWNGHLVRDALNLGFWINSGALNPTQIIWAPTYNGMHNEFRNVIRVLLLDQIVELRYQGGTSFYQKQDFRIILNGSFPPIIALNFGDCIHACCNFALHNGQS